MNVKLRKKIIVCMGRSAIYAIVVCCSLTMAIAGESSAQRKSLSEITLDVNYQGSNLIELLETIETSSDFAFAYSRREMKGKSVSIKAGKMDMDNLLRQISVQAKVSLKRVNETITIKEASNQDNLPEVTEVIAVEIVVTGKITDDNGEPLPGASVLEKGTTNGTITDVNGKFELSAQPDAVLLISFIGYTTEEVVIGNRTTIDVSLLPDIQSLQELVVVGYGSQKKSDFTGAVASLDAKTFQQQPVTTLEEGMQGRLPGVQVVQSSGQPGAGTSIRIRGVASLSGSSEPLFVIDGVPQFNSDVREANGLANIDPLSIESIEVLKDAASAAIYGSRAANGVVLITTKMGKSGKPMLTYSTNYGIQEVRNKLDMMSGQEYYNFVMDYYDNSIADGDLTEADKDQAVQEFNNTGINNTDFQDELFQTALRQSHNINISGGTDKSKYFINVGYLDQEGIIKTTDFKRYNLGVNLENEINNRLTVTTRLSASRSRQNRFVGHDGTNNSVGGKSGVNAILLTEPTIQLRDDDGKVLDARQYSFTFPNNVNPLAYLEATDQRTGYRVQGILEARIKIMEGLTNTVRFGTTFDDSKTDLFLPTSVSINAQQVKLDTRRNLNLLLENFVSYDKQLTDAIGLNAVAGISYQQDQRQLLSISGQGLPSDILRNNALQALNSINPPITNNIEQTLTSLFFRANFNIRERYLISGSIRRDGASQFAQGNKFASFPALSAAWRISEEAFLANNNLISNLKLRVSWGQLGNQGIEPYQSLTIGTSVNTPTGSGTGLNPALAPNLPNPDLTWETATQTNLGLDIGFMSEKYRMSVDFYEKNTKDLLAFVSLPLSAGFTQIIDNIGEIRNRGIELAAGIDIPTSSGLFITLDGNLSRNINEVVRTNRGTDIITGGSNDNSGSTLIVREGKSLSSFFLIKYLGNDENGLPIYEDTDGNDIIDDNDRQIVGQTLPDFVYGLNVRTDFKQFSLIMNWQGAAGLSVHNTLLNQLESSIGYNRRADVYSFYPRPSVNADGLNRNSSRFVEDASYLRLKNIKLNYSVPTKAIKFLQGIDVYISAQNLLTFTEYTGYDPEVNALSGSGLRQGIDLSAYPSVRTYTLGLNVKF